MYGISRLHRDPPRGSSLLQRLFISGEGGGKEVAGRGRESLPTSKPPPWPRLAGRKRQILNMLGRGGKY